MVLAIKRFAIPFGLCLVLAVLSSFEVYLWSVLEHRHLSFVTAFASRAPTWLVWAFLVPTVVRYAQRFRLEWPPRATPVLAHVGGILATAIWFDVIGSLVQALVPFDRIRPFWTTVVLELAYQSFIATIVWAATVGLGYLAEANRRAREVEQLRTQLAEAQLNALRAQLNPHFLFNALHTIAILVRERDEKQAVELIERLGDVLRHVLRTEESFEAPLAAEIAFVQTYMEIERARFGDRLKVSYGLGAELGGALVPQLILQPLVENALKHGLSPRTAAGHLEIAAERRGETLELVVCDDGVGLADDWDHRRGVGLANVRARLLRMYGDAARLALETLPTGGVRATVTLPYRPAGARG